jgi:small subunit ribosomal protein S20
LTPRQLATIRLPLATACASIGHRSRISITVAIVFRRHHARRPVAMHKTRTYPMANTTSAKKATRKIERRTEVNKARRSRMRTFLRKVEEAIASGDKGAAAEALKAAQPEIMRAAQKGIVHKNTASRKVSRLAHRIGALAS